MTASFEDPRRMTAEDVRSFGFGETRGFTRGYEESDVDTFVAKVADEIDVRDREIEANHQEIEHLTRRIMAGSADRVTQSVNILSRAQKTADEAVARADEHSARVMTEARAFYDDARRQAAKIVDEAARQAEEVAELAAADHGEIARQTAYLQTMREVARTQIEAFLMGLYDRVAQEYGQAHPAAAAEATAAQERQRPRAPIIASPQSAPPPSSATPVSGAPVGNPPGGPAPDNAAPEARTPVTAQAHQPAAPAR